MPCITSHYIICSNIYHITLHYIFSHIPHYITVYFPTYIILYCITLHYIFLHTSHYITLHYISFVHITLNILISQCIITFVCICILYLFVFHCIGLSCQYIFCIIFVFCISASSLCSEPVVRGILALSRLTLAACQHQAQSSPSSSS